MVQLVHIALPSSSEKSDAWALQALSKQATDTQSFCSSMGQESEERHENPICSVQSKGGFATIGPTVVDSKLRGGPHIECNEMTGI